VYQSINQSVNFYSGLSDRSHFEDHYSGASEHDRCVYRLSYSAE